MKQFFKRKKFIIQLLLLILVFSNFGFSFAYWASSILNGQSEAESSVQIGQWDFEDTALVVATAKIRYIANHFTSFTFRSNFIILFLS